MDETVRERLERLKREHGSAVGQRKPGPSVTEKPALDVAFILNEVNHGAIVQVSKKGSEIVMETVAPVNRWVLLQFGSDVVLVMLLATKLAGWW